MKKIISCLLSVAMLLSCNYGFSFADNKEVEDDLVFLKQLSDEELEPLVVLMKDRWTNQMPEEVIKHPKDHLYEIIYELEKYAGNTIANWIRLGKGVPYKEMLEDVCEHQKIKNFNKASVSDMGYSLVQQTFVTVLENMTEEQKEEFFKELRTIMGEENYAELLKEAGGKAGLWALSGNALAMLLVNSAGFSLYTAATVIVFGLFHALGLSVPYWLAWGGLATIVKTSTGILFGPIGWVVFGVWGAVNIASPATRVTVPAAIYIESMRINKKQNSFVNSLEYKPLNSYLKNKDTNNNELEVIIHVSNYDKAKQYIANLNDKSSSTIKKCPSCKKNTLIIQRYDAFSKIDFVVACKNSKCKFFELYKITRNDGDKNYKEYLFEGKYKNLSDVYNDSTKAEDSARKN